MTIPSEPPEFLWLLNLVTICEGKMMIDDAGSKSCETEQSYQYVLLWD